MTQNEFFNILMDELKELPELEIQKIILYYKKILSHESSLNKNEEDIIKDFGDPYLICINYKNKFKNIDNKNNFSSNINKLSEYNDHNKISYTSNTNDNKFNYDFYNKIKTENTDINQENKPSPVINKILKLFILILGLIIFFPILTTIIGIIFIPISILISSIAILIGETFSVFFEIPNLPQFITDFPDKVIVLFALGSITLSILMLYFLYYLFKFFFRQCKKILNLFKSKGGHHNE